MARQEIRRNGRIHLLLEKKNLKNLQQFVLKLNKPFLISILPVIMFLPDYPFNLVNDVII